MSETPVAHPTVWPWQSLVRVRHPSMLYDTDIATRETSLRVAMRSLVVVVFFWWSATGIIFALERSEALKETPRQYLNRLSDLLFVLSRVLNRMNGGDDVYWKSQRMVGHLSKIDAEGIMIDMIVDEDYHITEKPLYDTSVMKK